MDLRSRFTPERRRASGGAGGTVEQSSNHPAGGLLPPTHYWDFGDLARLYQDDELSTAISAAEQNIDGVDDKGTAEMDLGVATEIGPLYETTGGANNNSYGAFSDTDENTIQTSVSTYDWAAATDRTFLIVVDIENASNDMYLIDVAGSGDGIVIVNDHSSEFVSINLDGANTLSGSGDMVDITAEGPTAIIVTHASNGDAAAFASHTEEAPTAEITNQAQANVDWVLGSIDEGNAFHIEGRIYEITAWLEGSAPSVAELQDYTSSRYAVEWV